MVVVAGELGVPWVLVLWFYQSYRQQHTWGMTLLGDIDHDWRIRHPGWLRIRWIPLFGTCAFQCSPLIHLKTKICRGSSASPEFGKHNSRHSVGRLGRRATLQLATCGALRNSSFWHHYARESRAGECEDEFWVVYELHWIRSWWSRQIVSYCLGLQLARFQCSSFLFPLYTSSFCTW